MAINEFLVRYTSAQGSAEKVSVFHALDTVPVGDTAAALGTFFTALASRITSVYTISLDSVVTIKSLTTGQVTGVTPVTPFTPVVGTGGATSVADATQILFRWRTGVYSGGRELRGRTFVPGLAAGSLTAGNLAPAAITQFNSAAMALANPAGGDAIAVWSRVNGIAAAPTSGDVWAELAVQRRRRG